MAGPNFVLITELQTLTRRDFPVDDPALLQPLSTSPLALVDGEWLSLATGYKLSRAVAKGAYNTSPLVFPVHTERGRYDTQAIGKVNVLFLGMYEAETTLYDTSVTSLGQALVVGDPNSTGRNIIANRTVAKGDIVVGYVSKAPANGKVRFVHFGNQLIHTNVV